jgi:hypothetical protein
VKKVYARLIDDFYSDASFYKPTGDGLLVIVPVVEAKLDVIASKLVADAMSIVHSFADLCIGDKIINFQTPHEIGIGIARGPASRLLSKGKTLDYSGRVLNLASRLMDLARPRGVVLDSGFGIDLLPPATQAEFTKSEVYLKGVSPNSPVSIYSWPNTIAISDSYRHPLGEAKWQTISRSTTRKVLEEGAGHFRVDLTTPPTKLADPELTLSVEHPSPTPSGRKSKTTVRYFEHPASFVESAGIVSIRYSQAELAKRLSHVAVGWPIGLTLRYRTD